MDEYLEVLGLELGSRTRTYSFNTIYIGGGTPTALSEAQLGKLLNLVKDMASPHQPREYTIEANPGTLSPEKIRLMKSGSINRVSLGVQSFSERGLKILGRIHSPVEAEAGFYMLRRGGFKNINIDLIFGWPGQTLEEWEEDLQKVRHLCPEHVSTYCLTIERGTPLSKAVISGRLSKPEEELQHKMYEMAIDFLTKWGYKHYEISNFALKGKECLHNLNYWKNGPYIGIGAGAFSYANGRRFCNVKGVERYIKKISSGQRATSFTERLPAEKQAAETLLLALRVRQGIAEDEFYERTGYSISELYGPSINKLSRLGLLSLAGGRLHLTRKGLFLANRVMVEFL